MIGRRLLLLVVLATVAMAGDDTTVSQGMSNGRFWKAMNGPVEKVSFLLGMKDGINFALVTAARKFSPNTVVQTLQELSAEVLPAEEVSMVQIMGELDHFYMEPLNLPIPIMVALIVLKDRTGKVKSPEELIQLEISVMREKYSK